MSKILPSKISTKIIATDNTIGTKNVKQLLTIFLNTFTNFFEKVNTNIFANNTDFKGEVEICLQLYLIIFVIIILIFILTTSIVTIKYHEEICDNNESLKDDMNLIFNFAISNIIFTFIFIVLLILQYNYDTKYLFFIKILVILFFLLIISLNMVISSHFIINISKCNFKTNHLYNYMWINYAITLPICLLILILF